MHGKYEARCILNKMSYCQANRDLKASVCKLCNDPNTFMMGPSDDDSADLRATKERKTEGYCRRGMYCVDERCSVTKKVRLLTTMHALGVLTF